MRFTTSFFRVSILTLIAVGVSSCAYIIPENPNAPRNNEVLGDRHRPQLNTAVGPQSAASPRAPMPSERPVSSADVTPEPVTVATQSQSDRHVPVENVEFQMAANDTYPSLNSVPPRPVMTGPDSARERLINTESVLEQDRANAIESKAALDKDAAAEPSMLSELPKTDGVVPPNDPVRVVPIINPAPIAPPTVKVPSPNEIRLPSPAVAPSSSIAPVPSVAQPAIASNVAVTPVPPAPRAVIAAPAPVIAPHPPVAAQPVAIQQAYVPPAIPARPNVRPGDFDPLAVADNAPIATQASKSSHSANPSYASNGYIAPSRYADRRY